MPWVKEVIYFNLKKESINLNSSLVKTLNKNKQIK